MQSNHQPNEAPAPVAGAWAPSPEAREWLNGAYARRVLGDAVVVFPPKPERARHES